MEIYELWNYPREKKAVEEDIVELFTQEERVGFYQSYYNEILRIPDIKLLGANYGSRKPGGAAFPRGIETDDFVYEIDLEQACIIQHPAESRYHWGILSEMDKIATCPNVVIEGTVDEVIDEFQEAGFEVNTV